MCFSQKNRFRGDFWGAFGDALRPCSFDPKTIGIEVDWKGLKRILTCRGFDPPQSLWIRALAEHEQRWQKNLIVCNIQSSTTDEGL